MKDQNQTVNTPASRRRGRGRLTWLGAGLASLLGLALIGYIYETAAEAADGKAYPPLDTQSRSFNPMVALGRLGIVRLLAKPLGILPSAPPNPGAYYAMGVRPQSIQALIDDSKGMPAAAAQASAVKSFGDLPLIVLTARLNDIPGWSAWQTELLQLSSNSQQLFAENSGHNF